MTQKTALITGASRGLGAALARALAPTHHIIAVARTVGALEELDDAVVAAGGQATLAPMDICVPEAMTQLCAAIAQRWAKLDLWVHMAIHAAPLSPVPHTGDADFTRSIDVNLHATRRLITTVAPLLGHTGTAVFADDPAPGHKFHGSYGASKAAQMFLVRSWAAESARTGPSVRIVTPAPMPTALRARFFPGEDRGKLATPASEAARLLPEILRPSETGPADNLSL